MADIILFPGASRVYHSPPAPDPQGDPGDENDASPPAPLIIGLAGLKGCGKSTAARHLADEHGFSRLRFAAPLKGMITHLLDQMGLGHHQAWEMIEGAHKETPTPLFMGRSPRHAMQTLGTEWGRDLIGPDFWVACWRHMVEKARMDHLADTCGASAPFKVVAEDCRFPNEAAAVRALGGRVFWIDRPGLVAAGHASETSLTAADCDAIIPNDGAVLDLTRALDGLIPAARAAHTSR